MDNEMMEIMSEELAWEDGEYYPNYRSKIVNFMSDKNKELEFRKFIKEERRKDELLNTK